MPPIGSSSPSSSHSSRKNPKWRMPSLWGENIRCEYCSGTQFRRSRLTSDDVRHILLLTYPVRCLRCSQRQYVNLTVAALSRASSTRQPRPVNRTIQQGSWQEPAERMVLQADKQDVGDEANP